MSGRAETLWEATSAERESAAPLRGEAVADLAVIGGGFTGLSAALRAAEGGASVRLIEARRFGHGGSGRNVGLVNAGLWLPPRAIRGILGQETGERLCAALDLGPDLVFELIGKWRIACEAVRAGTLHCAHAPRGARDLEDRFEQLAERGVAARLLSGAQTADCVGSPRFHGALHDPRAGTIQPLAYARGLARAARECGALLHEATPAIRVSRDGAKWRVQTPEGAIRSEALIAATDAYLLPADGIAEPAGYRVGYFQCATDPLPPDIRRRILPGGEGCWDTARVMSSWRLDQAGRMIAGGVGSLGGAGTSAHLGWARRMLARTFPDLGAAALRRHWSGQILMSADHIPRIVSMGPGALACFGYSGRGIAPGTVFGARMADALLGGGMDLLPVPVTPERPIRLRAARQALAEAGAALAHALRARL